MALVVAALRAPCFLLFLTPFKCSTQNLTLSAGSRVCLASSVIFSSLTCAWTFGNQLNSCWMITDGVFTIQSLVPFLTIWSIHSCGGMKWPVHTFVHSSQSAPQGRLGSGIGTGKTDNGGPSGKHTFCYWGGSCLHTG